LSGSGGKVPDLRLRDTLREGLAIPGLLINAVRPALVRKPVGHGRPVIVIPGLLTGDLSTSFLRRSLAAAGFQPHGWGQGANTGASPGKLRALERRIASLHGGSGQKVVLIGWSLGGLYARVLAQRLPEAVELVMTVASPFSGDRRANRAWRLYELINDHTVDTPPFQEHPANKPPVPTIAVWSAVDGVVSPACTKGEDAEADYRVRVDAQHFALGSSPRCVARIIDILTDRLG
jgi:pimeloyl-ACP methyl ester carboxylesterase